jgi:hypothetical protein
MGTYDREAINKLDQFKEEVKDRTLLQKQLEDLQKEKQNIYNRENKIDEETKEVKSKINELKRSALQITIVDMENGEREDFNIEYVKDDGSLVCSTYLHYSHYEETLNVAQVQELKEKGITKLNDRYYVTSLINDPKIAGEVLTLILQNKYNKLIESKKHQEKMIADYQREVEQSKKNIEDFENTIEKQLERIYNGCHFGLTEIPFNKILEEMPRKINYKKV